MKKKVQFIKYGLGAVILFVLSVAIVFVINDNREKEMIASVKESVEFDIYLWGKGKVRFVGSSDVYQGGLHSTFGESVHVFGNKVELNDITQFTYDGGILIKFRYPHSIKRLSVYCHEISDPSALDDGVRTACFSDSEDGVLYLVQVGDDFYEVLDEAFFSDIKLLLGKEYNIE